MAGTPGQSYPWPPHPTPPTQEGESQQMQLEAALRSLREQRGQIAAEIGEYLYSLVLQGQLRDPVVVATFRRLYDHEQHVRELEANLRALPVAPTPVNQSSGFPAVHPVSPPPGMPAVGSEDAATRVAPVGRSSHDSASLPILPPDADETRIQPASLSREPQPSSLLPAGHDHDHDSNANETMIAPVRRPEPVAPSGGVKAAERRCTHCRMPLRANDVNCPVCGRPVTDQAAQAHSPQCRRCGTELRQQDRSCPVCGTPRT